MNILLPWYTPFPQPLKNKFTLQPWSLLKTHCLLCFGGDLQRTGAAQDDLGCIVCLDACFTPNTVFIPESDVKAMELFIGQQQSLPSIPTSVLDGCGAPFQAADEKRQKASTSFFADTGLMAFLCHHDHVLWLVNMKSAEERQHYALVLVKHLFEHLPATMTVGLLYDIGCQLEHSCHKWKLLDDGILSRLKFGISVFHANGHQWPCQLVYYPCKCVGFGLSDGEGCGQLWSSLKILVPTLQVSSHHQRLFVLDNQILHLDKKWLNKKWTLCKSKKMLALAALHAWHVDMQILREQWAAQVHPQTQPLPRQSKNKGAEQLAHILALEKTVEDYQCHVDQLEKDLVNDHHAAAKASLSKATQALSQKKKALGVSAHVDLHLLRNNKEWLHQHKFELERLEQSYRSSVNENHLQSCLVTAYNNLCGELQGMIWLQKAPPGAIAPPPIPSKGIFQLYVDSDIWQDVGIEEGYPDPPGWLADEGVCKGIRLMLEVDHCNEEERRLSREQTILQEWFSVEWKSVEVAQNNVDAFYKYHV
ncbi:hypothetical protein F5J12DRAFT_905259 [Pisolithus orientalis]|uniref:uncharacterized protein n=1 Tax=Pisolithus orientalis TaxID=936130 RepID=UPI00222408AC|nr:uncharacterized protein F5J12DRAFT_905259 [Pisolithus orientalis]KAI6008148.1 hypothetical protein F5J12DRAFT_905259 [Pisolithus orientalis]